MDIAERRVPQDGQLTLTPEGNTRAPPRVVVPGVARREDRDAHPLGPGAHPLREDRARRRHAGDRARARRPTAGLPRHERPDRRGQDVDALLVHAPHRHAAHQRDDARRPHRGRAPADHAGPDEREGRLHVRDGSPRHPAPGPGRHHGRRDPRRRDRRHRAPGVAHRSPRARRRCTRRTRSRARSVSSTSASSRGSSRTRSPACSRSASCASSARTARSSCRSSPTSLDGDERDHAEGHARS